MPNNGSFPRYAGKNWGDVRPLVLLFTFILYSHVVFCQSNILINEETIKVSYRAIRLDSGKKKDKWQIDITAETPAEAMYFGKAGGSDDPTKAMLMSMINPGSDHYVKVSVTNHAGGFGSSDKFLTAEKANVVTASNTTFYEVLPGAHNESFTVEVPAGKIPKVEATVLAPLQPAPHFDFVRAEQDVLFSGSQPGSRIFLVYNDLDTLLVRRDPAIAFLNRDHKPAQASYTNELFIVRNNSPARDSLVTQLSYLDWTDHVMTFRIQNGTLETSVKGTFADAVPTAAITLKDADGNRRMVKLEPMKKNVLVFNTPIAEKNLPSSDNGRYVLRMGGANGLSLGNTSTGQVVWSIMAVGAAPRGLMVADANHMITANLLSYTTNATGIPEKGAFMMVSDDGNLYIFRSNGLAIWSSHTAGK